MLDRFWPTALVSADQRSVRTIPHAPGDAMTDFPAATRRMSTPVDDLVLKPPKTPSTSDTGIPVSERDQPLSGMSTMVDNLVLEVTNERA